MAKELLLLRHGKSDRSIDTDDFHKPLKDRGKRGAQRMGVWLQQQQLLPDLILSSPAERAINTAEKLCKAMDHTVRQIQQDDRIYASDAETLLHLLSTCPTYVERLLLVGHNPELEYLLMYLADADLEIPHDGKLLASATLARLIISADWNQLQQGCAKVISITRASSLPKAFPYPTPEGAGLRKRPAYYYTQSSVIPYRIADGKLSILLISSSKLKHWVVPKGIVEPGLSAQLSASKEAWEEAGIEGTVGEQLLGSYQYEKWGASCFVQVYPFAVTSVVPESEWEESHRGRKWFTVQQAAKLLKQQALVPMLEKIADIVAC